MTKEHMNTDTPDPHRRTPVQTITATVEVPANATFSNALHVLKAGGRITRAAWPRGAYVMVHRPDVVSHPVFVLHGAGEPVLWEPSLSCKTGRFPQFFASTEW